MSKGVCEHCGDTNVWVRVCSICKTRYCTRSPRNPDQYGMCSWYHEGWPSLLYFNVATGEEVDLEGCCNRADIYTPEGLRLNPNWVDIKPITLARRVECEPQKKD